MAAGDKLHTCMQGTNWQLPLGTLLAKPMHASLNTYHLWKLEEEEAAISSKTGACNAPVRSEKPVHSPHDKW